MLEDLITGNSIQVVFVNLRTIFEPYLFSFFVNIIRDLGDLKKEEQVSVFLSTSSILLFS